MKQKKQNRGQKPFYPAKEKAKPNIRRMAIDIILKIFYESGYSNHLLEAVFKKNETLSTVDRGFLKALVFGVLRNRYQLDSILESGCSRGFHKLPKPILTVLEVGLFQMLFMDRVPNHAAVDESVRLARRYGHAGTAKLVNAILRNLGKQESSSLLIKINKNSSLDDISVATSHPEWLVGRLVKEHGIEAAIRVLEADNEQPPLNYRVADEAGLNEVDSLQIENNLYNKHGVTLPSASVKEALQLMQDGLICPQDESSLIAVSLFDGACGKLLELCSGRGNKSSALLQVIDNKATLLSADLSVRKLSEAGSSNRKTSICLDASKQLPFSNKFDFIFMDMPCSNLGVIRRHPEIRYSRAEADIKAAAALQWQILNRGADVVAGGGTLLYSVCSVEREESFANIERLLKERSEFSSIDIGVLRPELKDAGLLKDGCLYVLPGSGGMDGFFTAMLKKS